MPGLQDADIIFPLNREEVSMHANKHRLVDIAFRCPEDFDVFTFDPADIVCFSWQNFIECVFRWAIHLGIRPISMIGSGLPRRGYDLKEDFDNWLLDATNDERVTALI